MKYRNLSEITKSELDEFVCDTLFPERYEIVDRGDGEITISMWSKWFPNSEELLEDEVILNNRGSVYADFYQEGVTLKWIKFLVARGYYYLFEDNEYLEEEK